MIFDTLDFIVEITKYITMQPGDVLWMGADGTLPIGPGDTVEINISGIGTLRNSVVLETPQTPKGSSAIRKSQEGEDQ